MNDAATQLLMLQGVKGKAISLTRGATSVQMLALRGWTKGEMCGADGTQTEFETTDWMVTTDQTGTIGKPQRGDLITCGSTTYTVAHPDPNTRAVAFHDNEEQTYRIHTIQNGQ